MIFKARLLVVLGLMFLAMSAWIGIQQPSSAAKPVAPPAPASSPRLIFAHYMVNLPTYGTDVASFKREIQEAQAIGIDGFALNIPAWTSNTQYQTNTANLFEAAKQLGSG